MAEAYRPRHGQTRATGGLRHQILQNALPQVLQSGTNFLLTLGFAHALAPQAFGVLSAFWLVWMLVLSFNRTVFGEQLIARAHTGTSVVGYGSVLTPWIAGLAVITLVVLGMLGDATALLPGVLCVILFVASDAVRYDLIHTSVVEHGGWSLLGWETVRAVLAVAFYIAVVASAPAGLVAVLAIATGGVLLLPALPAAGRLRVGGARAWLSTMGSFEAWMSLQFFTLTAANHLLPLAAATLFSASAFGSLRLTQSVTNPAALVATAFQPVLITTFGKAVREGHRLRSLLARIVGLAVVGAVVISAAAVAVVVGTGRWWLPADQTSAVSYLILPAIVAVGWVMIGQPAGALIRVLHLGRQSMAGQLIGLAITLAAVAVLLPHGILGFTWALTIGTAATMIATYALILPHLAADRSTP
ncbi:hypothetical protein [Kribbia dieselivorans]|uniref:hypothetical protein n=1 Tax=Kribbia dieselivorans TaxID=331526 RepID=UPI0008395C63|nr:hypothetical protein [Kribbia dieselivorans]